MDDADAFEMPRGTSRPVNSVGLPVPYLAVDAERLGTVHQGRRVEVTRDWLCQVCGEAFSPTEPRFAVVSTDPDDDWPADWVMDFGLLHEPCLRLALLNCPILGAWSHKRLLRVKMTDVHLTQQLQATVPTSLHEALEVAVATYL